MTRRAIYGRPYFLESSGPEVHLVELAEDLAEALEVAERAKADGGGA